MQNIWEGDLRREPKELLNLCHWGTYRSYANNIARTAILKGNKASKWAGSCQTKVIFHFQDNKLYVQLQFIIPEEKPINLTIIILYYNDLIYILLTTLSLIYFFSPNIISAHKYPFQKRIYHVPQFVGICSNIFISADHRA